MIRWMRSISVLLAAAALLAPATAQDDPYAGKSQAQIMQEILGTAPVDQFNPDVTDATRGKETPRRGGVLRVRANADFDGFNPFTSSTADGRRVEGYLFDGMVNQDAETLEFFPELAWTWAIGDLLKMPGEAILEGTFLDHGDWRDPESTVQFVPSAFRRYFGKSDVAEVDIENGRLVLTAERGGAVHEGRIEEKQYVYEVNEAHAPANMARVIEQKMSELDTWTDAKGGRGLRPFAKRDCAFYFAMRSGPTWHDGRPVTAQDVKFSYDALMNVNVDAMRIRNYLEDVVSCEVLADGQTLHFQANRPYYKMFESLIGILPILPRHVFNPEQFGGDDKAFGDAFNTHGFRERPIGNGPWKFAEWRKGTSVRLVRNDKYWKNELPDGTVARWKNGQPWLDEILFVVADKTAAVKEMQKGSLDVDDGVAADVWLQDATNAPDFTAPNVRAIRPGFGYTYVGWNAASPIFRDKETRRAIGMLIPRDRIIRDIHHDLHTPVNGPFFNRSPEYDRTIEPIPYDSRAAVRELRRAGWLDRDGDGIIEKEIDGRMVPFRFTYLIHNAMDYHQKVADIVKESVEQAGIRMDIRKIDWSLYSDEVRAKNFDAVRFAWTSVLDSDPYQIWHSSQIKDNGDNFISYRNPRVDELLELHREEFDPLRRWEMKREMHRLIHDDQPVFFQFAISDMMFYSRKLRGVKLYPSWLVFNFNEWWFVDETRRRETAG